jgi:hypothetical protein
MWWGEPGHLMVHSFTSMLSIHHVPGLVASQGLEIQAARPGLCPFKEFLALGQGDARFEPPDLSHTCSVHILCG